LHTRFQKIQEFGITIDTIQQKILFVTDQGSNFLKALNDLSRIDCACHALNLALSNAFEKDLMPKENSDQIEEECAEILQCISDCKSLVTYFVQTGLKIVSTEQHI